MADDDRPPLPRATLPKNLPEILKRLEDLELETLLRDVAAEAERRGVIKPAKANAVPQKEPAARKGATQAKGRDAQAAVPAGKTNLILASHQTGMKPTAIARSLRLSLSVVNQILDQAAKPRK